MPSARGLDQPQKIRSRALLTLACTALLGIPTASAQDAQTQDPNFAASVQTWTTAPEFSSPRWQTHGEFNMLFNAPLHHNDMPAPSSAARPKGLPPWTRHSDS